MQLSPAVRKAVDAAATAAAAAGASSTWLAPTAKRLPISTRPDPTMALCLLVLCRMSPSNMMMFRRLLETSDAEGELLAAAGLRAGADAAAGEAAGCSRDCSKCCLELVCLADFAAGVAREVAMHLTRVSICALLRAHACILASMHVPRMLPAGVKDCLPRFSGCDRAAPVKRLESSCSVCSRMCRSRARQIASVRNCFFVHTHRRPRQLRAPSLAPSHAIVPPLAHEDPPFR